MEEYSDYVFVNTHKEQQTTPVKILTGEFKDVIVCFGTLKITESNDDQAIASFTFEVLEPGGRRERRRLQKNNRFKEHLGKILHAILEETLVDDETGTDYIEESDDERRLLKEDTTIPEE